jgi:hypothetical protein
MHLFSTRTSSGILYEVDARLRPSGAAGMLVTSTESFADYQRTEAWTWEHQALVRARVVYGDPQLNAQFDAIRRDITMTVRDGATLQTEVREMREKMRAHLSNKQDRFDLKPMRWNYRYRIYHPVSGAALCPCKTETDALVGQCPHSGRAGAKRHYGRAGSAGTYRLYNVA